MTDSPTPPSPAQPAGPAASPAAVRDDKAIQAALAAIPGLEIGDLTRFFDAKASPRDRAIAAMVDTNDELEIDGAIVSESDDNGAWVNAWVWVDFSDTAFDKDNLDEDAPDDAQDIDQDEAQEHPQKGAV